MFQFLSKLYFLQNSLARFISQLIPPFLMHNLGKYFAIKKAFYLINLEDLAGEYIEFGVFTGSSMSCAMMSSRYSRVGNIKNRKFIGFDSFEGFGELNEKDKHPFYNNLNFKTDYKSVQKRLMSLKGSAEEVTLVKGFFNETCDNIAPSTYGINLAAVVMIDNDTYSGAQSCFRFIEPILQEGTIIILDDFFSYKGSDEKGLCGAFTEFAIVSKFKFRQISDYGMGGVLMIVSGLK